MNIPLNQRKISFLGKIVFLKILLLESNAFHNRCDGKANAITAIVNNLNYVFGGYVSSDWNSSRKYIFDPNTFLFSLRSNGVHFKDKFAVKMEKLLSKEIHFMGQYMMEVMMHVFKINQILLLEANVIMVILIIY